MTFIPSSSSSFPSLCQARRLCSLLLAVSGLCSLGFQAKAQVTPQRPPAAPAVPKDALKAAATNVGVRRCLPAISRLSSITVNGSTGNDVLVDWERKNPDDGPFFSLSGVEYKNASLAFSLTAVPDAAGGCSVAAERISVAPFACKSIAQQELGGYKATQLLATFTVYLDARDPGASVALIDSPPGCLIIRRHVEYDWKDPTKAKIR